MKIKTTLSLISILFVLASCRKSNPQGPEKIVVPAIEEPQPPGSTGPLKVLSRIVPSGFNASAAIDLKYDNAHRLVQYNQGTEQVNYVYEANRLVKITKGKDVRYLITQYTYEGNRVKTAVSPNSGDEAPATIVFNYDGDRLTRLDHMSAGVLTATESFEYRRNNTSRITYDDGAHVRITDYTYDNRRYFDAGLKRYLLKPGELYLRAPIADNNELTTRVEYLDEQLGFQYIISRTYTYDNTGFPLTLTTRLRTKSGIETESKATFEYIILE
ncbi:MAG: hypothetical protein EOO92_26560 [Pedobacter sp.]|nr:MAG: hypothetical protein EOO92_26560 [Pedobacter sp.]